MDRTENGSLAPNGMGVTEENTKQIDIGELLIYLLNRIWIVVLVTALCGVGAYFYAKMTTVPLYRSTAKLFIISKGSSDSLSTSAVSIASKTVGDCMRLVADDTIVDKTIENLGLSISTEDLKAKIKTSTPDADTSLIIEVSVSDEDPQLACDIANELCRVSTTEVRDIMGLNQVNIASAAKPASKPYNLTFMSTAAKFGAVGFVFTCLVLFVIFYFDDKIKTADDVEKYLGLTVLGVIPNTSDK